MILLVLSWHSVQSRAGAQELTGNASVELLDATSFPLRPPDLHSPRETLRSFMINAREAIELIRKEAPPEAIRRAMRRAILCLDLSKIPLATRESIGAEKVLLLNEILDRIQLPPQEEIPGLAEVEENNLSAWIIPNTELTISRIEEGPYLDFSSSTNARSICLSAFTRWPNPYPISPALRSVLTKTFSMVLVH